MFFKIMTLVFIFINSFFLYGNELQIKFFGTKNCSDCARIEFGILRNVLTINANIKIEKNFIETVESFENLLLHEKQYGAGSNSNATVKIYVGYFPNDVQCLSGVTDIENNLQALIKEYENKPYVSKNIMKNTKEFQLSHKVSLKQFAIMPLLIAGFLDGLNPCVFSSIIFLLGLLSVAGVINLKLLWVGIAFCCGSFVSYTLLGLLFFYIMDIMNELQIIKIIFKYIFIFLLVFFATISIINAYKIKKKSNFI